MLVQMMIHFLYNILLNKETLIQIIKNAYNKINNKYTKVNFWNWTLMKYQIRILIKIMVKEIKFKWQLEVKVAQKTINWKMIQKQVLKVVTLAEKTIRL